MKTAGELVKGNEPDKLVKRHRQRQEMERVREQMEQARGQLGAPAKRLDIEPVPGSYGTLGREKRAAAAASLGRRMAHGSVNQELAKIAGAILAGRIESDQEFEKVASLMVQTGALSEEEFWLEKEAGWSGLRSLFSKARGALKGARGKIGKWFAKRRTPSFNRGKAAKGWSSGPKQAPEVLGGPKVKAPSGGAPAPSGGAPKKPWKFPTWKAALGLGALGTVYAGSKLVPAAARAIESTSTTPMAYGLGWSPVNYGYGYTPYGPGMATMGGGA